jgi:NAD(P)-dependent dehydrogenase (short-subunit alcohol dehydrogenase family)
LSGACSPFERGWLLWPAILLRIFLPTRSGYREMSAAWKVCRHRRRGVRDSWQDDFNTNFFSAVRLTATRLPGMLAPKSGAIISSPAWCAREQGDPGNVVTPGADVVRADFTKAFGITPETMTAAIPLGKMGVPQDIAEIAGFLISGRAAWITGSNFIVDGGQNPTV